MKGLKILIVDDDREYMDLLARILSEYRPDDRVRFVESEAACIAALDRETFDVALVDFNLVTVTADDLIERLSQRFPECAYIAMSGSDRQDVAVRSMRSGSRDFLNKDDAIDPEKLDASIRTALKTHRNNANERRRLQRRISRLQNMAYRDSLTGLANRRAADELLAGNGRTILDRRGDIAAILFDIDHFKNVNDEHGHACGDQVLRNIAEAIRTQADCSDVCARWGGEEFLIIKFDTNHVDAMVFAEELRHRIEAVRTKFEGKCLTNTISVGVATAPATEFEQKVVARADQALYFAKEHGRNRVCHWRQAEFSWLIEDAKHQPDGILREAVNHYSDNLGATQFEQITSHSYAVAELAITIGSTLGIANNKLIPLKNAGKYHDIGKIFVPEDVLAKPGPLTPEERRVIDRHAAEGAEMAAIAGFDEETCDSIRTHHRRFDQLRDSNEQNDHMGGQILQVADALTTMTTCRPYRDSRSIGDALVEIRNERGRQFSPDIVDAALATFS